MRGDKTTYNNLKKTHYHNQVTGSWDEKYNVLLKKIIKKEGYEIFVEQVRLDGVKLLITKKSIFEMNSGRRVMTICIKENNNKLTLEVELSGKARICLLMIFVILFLLFSTIIITLLIARDINNFEILCVLALLECLTVIILLTIMYCIIYVKGEDVKEFERLYERLVISLQNISKM